MYVLHIEYYLHEFIIKCKSLVVPYSKYKHSLLYLLPLNGMNLRVRDSSSTGCRTLYL